MIGNDVVDLADPETNPRQRHPRFDERVFSVEERRALSRSAKPERERWIRWAAKEAAYKLLRAECGATVFSPSRFEVVFGPPASARVRWRARVVVVDLLIAPSSVHAVARTAEADAIVSAVEVEEVGEPGRAVRALVVRRLADRLGISRGDLRVERPPARPPVLLVRDRPIGASLSLSHHGRFVAFACELPPGAGWAR